MDPMRADQEKPPFSGFNLCDHQPTKYSHHGGIRHTLGRTTEKVPASMRGHRALTYW